MPGFTLDLGDRPDERDVHDQNRVVIGGNPRRLYLAAPQACVDDLLLAIATDKQSLWSHQRPTVAASVAWVLQIDVQRVQAVRAVVSVPPTRQRCADELAALAAPKGLILLGAWRSPYLARPRSVRLPLRRASLASSVIFVRVVICVAVVLVIARNGIVRSQWHILRIRIGGCLSMREGSCWLSATQVLRQRRLAQGLVWMTWFTSGGPGIWVRGSVE